MAIQCVVIQHGEGANFPNGWRPVNWNYTVLSFPLEGAIDPDMEILVKRTPFIMPDYDPRLFDLKTVQGPSEIGEFDTQHPTQRMWLTIYSLQAVNAVELEKAVDEAEQMANLNQIDTQRILKFLAIAAAVADRRAQGLVITPAMTTFMTVFHAKAQKIWENNVVGMDKKAALQAGQPVNLDQGWQ